MNNCVQGRRHRGRPNHRVPDRRLDHRVHFILGAITTILIAALVVGGVARGVKVARSRKQVSRKREEKQVREPDYSEYARPLPRADIEVIAPQPSRPGAQDVDDELARLKREMGR